MSANALSGFVHALLRGLAQKALSLTYRLHWRLATSVSHDKPRSNLPWKVFVNGKRNSRWEGINHNTVFATKLIVTQTRSFSLLLAPSMNSKIRKRISINRKHFPKSIKHLIMHVRCWNFYFSFHLTFFSYKCYATSIQIILNVELFLHKIHICENANSHRDIVWFWFIVSSSFQSLFHIIDIFTQVYTRSSRVWIFKPPTKISKNFNFFAISAIFTAFILVFYVSSFGMCMILLTFSEKNECLRTWISLIYF